MGNQSSVGAPNKKLVKQLAEATHFSADEVQALWHHFKGISASQEDDGRIDKSEFQAAMMLKDSVLLDRMFDIFDSDRDGFINFTEFLNGLSTLSNKASRDEKLQFSFDLYDFAGDHSISQNELAQMLRASVDECDLIMTDEQVYAIVEATFIEANPAQEGRIHFEEYCQLVHNHPYVISALTLNISELIAEYKQAVSNSNQNETTTSSKGIRSRFKKK